MPLEFGIWRIDGGLRRVEFTSLDFESRLEDILDEDITIADPRWMIIGRQILTAYGKFIDLLAIDRDGNLIVIELKRDKTPRDIIAQVLDYGSWIHSLRTDFITQTFQAYLKKYHPERPPISIDEAFRQRFGVSEMPEELNESHELVIVASVLDSSTERIVKYLADVHEMKINAVFFRIFKDGDREFLTRAWLNDPVTVDAAGNDNLPSNEDWNGEYYVSFGADPNRDWEEAKKYGFISGGGGAWYSRTLELLEKGARIWVNIPGEGYVGVGVVEEPEVVIDDFQVADASGKMVPITSLPIKAAKLSKASVNQEKAEHLVRVKWQKTVPQANAIKEKGFFGNQNTVAQPKSAKWLHTVDRLKERLGMT